VSRHVGTTSACLICQEDSEDIHHLLFFSHLRENYGTSWDY
jgi:hypothetical protein